MARDDPDELLTAQETAELLRVAVVTLRRWRREGRGPPFLWTEGRPRYRRGDVLAWLRRRRP
jgi:predicted site-specific integrase-resolvase